MKLIEGRDDTLAGRAFIGSAERNSDNLELGSVVKLDQLRDHAGDHVLAKICRDVGDLYLAVSAGNPALA